MSGKKIGLAAYAVIGHPVRHSLSPLIHRHFAQHADQALSYDLLEAPPDGFAAAAQQFFETGGCGLNVTLPFKEQAKDFVQHLSPEASVAGAVNTIVPVGPDATDAAKPGLAVTELVGHNTDGAGLVQDLKANLGWALDGARVLLIGAGGASRGALAALLAERPDSLVITNRTIPRATALAEHVAPDDSRVQVLPASALRGSFDVVINATSASLAGQGALVPTEVVVGARCYDMLYAPTQTVFAGWAQSHGAADVADGLGMLLEQAAEAFALWRGVRPQTSSLLAERHNLFAAHTAGARSLTSYLEASTVDHAGSADPGVQALKDRRKRQFIAGAVCPQCRSVDRIVIDSTPEGREQSCIECGYSEPEGGAQQNGQTLMVPRGKPERAPAIKADSTPSEPVRFIDPKSADNAAEKD